MMQRHVAAMAALLLLGVASLIMFAVSVAMKPISYAVIAQSQELSAKGIEIEFLPPHDVLNYSEIDCDALVNRFRMSKTSSAHIPAPSQLPTICVIDASFSHLDLLINSFLSLLRIPHLCSEFQFIAYDQDAASALSRLGFSVLFNHSLIHDARSYLASHPGCPEYLFLPMYVRSFEFTRLVGLSTHNVFLTDADTVFLRNPFSHSLRDSVVVSMHVVPEGKHTEKYYGNFIKPHFANGSWATLNNGVIAVTGGETNAKRFKKLYDEYILPRLCEEGFAQTGFNDYVHVEHKAALVPDDQVTNEYVGQFLDGNGGVLRAYTNILTADWMDVQIRTLSTPSAWATQRQREQNGFGIGALGCFAKRSRTRI